MDKKVLIESFLAALPKGEYSSLQILSNPEGLMAAEFDTVLAEAVWLRHGNPSCFLKAIKVSDFTNISMIGLERLGRIKDRVEKAKILKVPIVDVFFVGFIGDNNEFFLLSMDKVTPLDKVQLDRRGRIELAIKILTQLSSPMGDGWHHFDLCLKNLGLSCIGDPVFIDLDSLYLMGGDNTPISMPVGKPWRVPGAIQRDWLGQWYSTQTVSNATLQQKQSFDLALAAAEITLPHDISGRPQKADDWVAGWLSCSDDDKLVEFWRAPLISALDGSYRLDLNQLADGLNNLLELDAKLSQVEVDTSNLQNLGSLMRNDMLTVPQLKEYREKLILHLGSCPNDYQSWHELRLLCSAYLKDFTAAIDATEKALQQFPSDDEFLRWYEVFKLSQLDGKR